MAKDYDDDDRPARRPRDDDDYDDRPRRDSGVSPGGMDKFFGNIGVGIGLAIFGFICCPCISIILGAIGMGTCKTPEAKKHAMFSLAGGCAGILLNIILNVTGIFKFDPKQFGM